MKNSLLIAILLHITLAALAQKRDTLSVMIDEVVVSATRFEQKITRSPVTINLISARAIQSAASGDYFESLGNLAQIDIVNNSFNFKVFNTRGFNTTVGYRVVQMVDGADNLSSGINFSPGNFLSIPDIDMQRTEIISGPASALYGPNALQGVISITSKNPYEHEGLDVKVAGGTRAYFAGQFRYAQTVGKNKRFAFKISGEYNRARDWVGDDPKANVYIPRPSAPQNLNQEIQNIANNINTDANTRQLYNDFLTYAANNPSALPGTKVFTLKGYKENELFDSLSQNLKLATSIHYRFKNQVELSASYRMVRASGTFQGNQRVYFDNQLFHQPKIEVSHKNFVFRTYATFENLGNSYSFNILGANLALAGLPNFRKAYVHDYIQQAQLLSNNFVNGLDSSAIANIQNSALLAAQEGWLKPGSDAFNAASQVIVKEAKKPQGARFVNESKMFHAEGQYNFSIKKWIDFNVGASFRYNIPRTLGTVLSDTLLANGKYTNIAYYETGGFIQFTKSFWRDIITISGSLRVDKSTNFEPQISPRGSITFNLKNHNIRLLAQSAFRNPTQNEQYFLLNTGALIVLGNVTGYENLYTLSSVSAYSASGNEGVLKTIAIPKLKPENVKSFEMGYRGNLFKRLTIDVNGYFNIFSNFIGRINTAQPKSGNVNDSSGIADLKSGNIGRYSIMANSSADIYSYGASISLNCYLAKGISIYANYTFADLDSSRITDDLIPGFNTPNHKINVGIEGNKVWKGLGFAANFRWVDDYYWQSPFANGLVPSFHVLDLQLNYTFDKAFSTIRLGASNIYNNRHIEAFGAGKIGAFYYASYTVSIAKEDFKRK